MPVRLVRGWRAVARRKRLSLALVGLAPLILRAALVPWLGVPNPRVQDEFSHLLVADTFAHGRMVNPVHPMWAHFESMHILVRPVYASAFPVAPGLVMAAAQLSTGRPWTGVWLVMGVLCATLCWMLQGWVPPEWALLGGLLAAARFGVFSYWMNSYYGGTVAAIGGALVLGALPRLMRSAEWKHGALLGAGLAILANSRPYEGALFALPLLAAQVWSLRARPRSFASLAPAVLVLAVAAIPMGVYFSKITGSPFQLPYAFYRAHFTMAPHFVWQQPRPEPEFHHRVLRDFHKYWEMAAWGAARANRAPYGLFDKAKTYWRFYLGPFLTLPLLTVPWLWRRRRTRLLLLAGVFIALGLAVEVWHAPHYAAPALGLCLLLVIGGLRQLPHLRLWRRIHPAAGTWAVRAIVAGGMLTPVIGGSIWMDDGSARARIVRQFADQGRSHLVIVRYRLDHDSGDEWVYNAAGIDGAPIVWAREMDPTSNRALLRYFPNRRAWLLEPARPALPLRQARHGGCRDAALPRRSPAEDTRQGCCRIFAAVPFQLRPVGILLYRGDGRGIPRGGGRMLPRRPPRYARQFRGLVGLDGAAALSRGVLTECSGSGPGP